MNRKGTETSLSPELLAAFWHLNIIEALLLITFIVIVIMILVKAVIALKKELGIVNYFRRSWKLFFILIILALSFFTLYVLDM